MNKFKKILKSISKIRNPIPYILDTFYLMDRDYILVFKNGIKFFVRHARKGVVSDNEIIEEVTINDQYKIVDKNAKYKNIVDIGAQIGTFAITFARMYPGSQIIAYEPNLDNYKQLEKNISLNKLELNIKALNLAVTDKKGTAKLFVNSVNIGGHSVFGSNFDKFAKVGTISLEDVLKMNKFKTIDLLKMDCEGEEYKIFLSTPKRTLQKISTIILELHETPETTKHYSSKDLLSFLVRNGFEYKILKEIYYEDEGRFWILTAKQK